MFECQVVPMVATEGHQNSLPCAGQSGHHGDLGPFADL